MSTSNFRRKNRKIISEHADQLIQHITDMDPTEDNFGIARKFIWGRFDNNSFPDVNEHLVKDQWRKLEHKFKIHSQDNRAQRLEYLYKEFHKR